jgi:hypothetical protein
VQLKRKRLPQALGLLRRRLCFSRHLLLAGILAGPSPATPKEILTAMELTDVPDPPQQAAGTRIKPFAPVLVTLSVAGAVAGIGTWLAAQEPGSVVGPAIPQQGKIP